MSQLTPDPLREQWRALALKFDAHRMAAIAHLRLLLDNPTEHAVAAREFLAAAPSSTQSTRLIQLSERLKDFPTNDAGEPIIYDTQEIDEITHALTGDEGEEDSITVLNSLVRYAGIVHPGKTLLQVLIETEEAAATPPPAKA